MFASVVSNDKDKPALGMRVCGCVGSPNIRSQRTERGHTAAEPERRVSENR